MNKSIFLLIISIIAPALFSCSDQDKNIWDDMEWNARNFSTDDIQYSAERNEITVNYKGGQIDLTCTNYNNIFFAFYTCDNPQDIYYHYRAQHFELTIEGNVIHCIFTEDASGKPMESFEIPVTTGYVFSTIHINRSFGELNP